MNIKRNGSQPSGKGPADYFTGTVRIDSPFRSSARRVLAVRSSHSNRVLAPPGTRIRWGRP